jgi:excisionase family DNA binding protein
MHMSKQSETQTNIPRLLTIPQTAEALGVSCDTVRRLCDRRELRYVQSGPNAAKRIAVADLQKWIDRNAVEPVRR